MPNPHPFLRSLRSLRSRRLVPAAILAAALGFGLKSRAADHRDSPDASESNLDINDIYAFSRGDSLVLAMTVNPFLTPGSATQGAAFNPDGLYQFKLDRERDGVEETVIQITFSGTGTGQEVIVRGPAAPSVKGTAANVLLAGEGMRGRFDETFGTGGVRVFAGPRDDPFFLHLMGDSSLTSVLNAAYSAALDTTVGDPQLQSLGFSRQGKDDFAGTNVLAIVVQLPKSALSEEMGLAADGKLYVWGTTSIKD